MRRALPPFLVGVVSMGAAELSLSLLLYSRPGFVRALTVLLSVQLASLAVGLATGPGLDAQGRWTSGAALSLRWRWLLAVVALGIAAFVAGGWTLLGGLEGSSMQRGVAVAAMASLPLLTLGGVLSGLAARSRDLRVGAWAVAGGAVGAVAMGALLTTRLLPPSILLASTVLVSAGALIDGRLDAALFAASDEAEREPAGPPVPTEVDDVVPIESLAPDRLDVVPGVATDRVVPIESLAPDPPVRRGAPSDLDAGS